GRARLAIRPDAPTCARCRFGHGVCSCILLRPVGRSVGATVFENAGYRNIDLRWRPARARHIHVYHLSRNDFSPTHRPTERKLAPVDLCNQRGRDRIISWRVFLLDDRGERSRHWRAGRCAAPWSIKFFNRRPTRFSSARTFFSAAGRRIDARGIAGAIEEFARAWGYRKRDYANGPRFLE